MKYNLFNKVYERILDDDPGAGDGGGENKDDANKMTVTVTVDPRTKRQTFKTLDGKALFTQEHMSHEIGEARKKEGEKNKTLVTQLEELRDNSTTSESVRNELQAQIEDLNAASMTQQQQAELEMKRIKRKHETDLKTATESATSWQTRYSKSFISQEIRRAAAESKALPLAVEQLDVMLGSQATLRNLKDDKGADIPDQYEAVVNFRDVDENKNEVITVLSIPKAIARMRELPERFGNLFESDQKGGVGSGNSMLGKNALSGTQPDFANMTVPEYAKWRAANLDKVGEQ